ncbi:MAG: response regulator transcription factor [Bacteroidaceae bacterium]|nr:response regulator transcription factor [Bacteroidaceae bacterium]
MITCIIIDDEPLAQALLESYVEKTPFLQLKGVFSNAIEAMAALHEAPVQLVFLDIQMPELSGLELAKLIPGTSRIVFTTAFGQYAIEGYKVNAFDYLLKPFSYNDFLNTALRAKEQIETEQAHAVVAAPKSADVQDQNSFFVRSDYKLIRVNYEDILYVEGLKDYVKIYLTTQTRPILSLTSMKAIEEHLTAEQFMRIHRSYVVNMLKVTAVERSNVLIGEKSLPISETYKDKVLEYIHPRLLSGR